jgi:hypothetical protein
MRGFMMTSWYADSFDRRFGDHTEVQLTRR